MSATVVTTAIVFDDWAAKTANIFGPWNPRMTWFDEQFTGKALDAVYKWTETADAGNSLAFSNAVPGGIGRITTSITDDHAYVLASELIWKPSKNPILEVRARCNDVAGLAWNIGFSDAQGDKIAMTYSGTTLTSTATNFAGFLYDPDADTDDIYGVSVKGDADGLVWDSEHAEANASWATYRVEILEVGVDASGNTTYDVLFYLNTSGDPINPEQQQIGREIDGLADVPLCIYIAVQNRNGEADTFDIFQVRAWQNV